MLRELTINIQSYLKSRLTPSEYIILILIHKKELKLLDHIAKSLFGVTDTYYGEVFTSFQDDGWLKITGDNLPDDLEVRQKFLNLLDVKEEGEEKPVLDDWYREYRMLFKNTGKKGAIGDRAAIISKFRKFFISNPEYSKEEILEATKTYIRTCAPSYKYMMQADYFISKVDKEGIPHSRLLTFLEEETEGTTETDFTTQI